MTIRLAVHVGPHKTGSTSVQRALAANRERLADSGVWYPPSLANAQFPDQHADIAILLATSLIPSALEWLQQAGDEAGRRGCDTVFLSSENFRAPQIRHRLGILLRDHRRRTGAETRLLYVRRESAALARSTVMARLDGELGFFFREHYDLRTWAAPAAAGGTVFPAAGLPVSPTGGNAPGIPRCGTSPTRDRSGVFLC